MKPFIILQHPSYVGKAFDFLVHKDFLNDERIKDDKDCGYNLKCKYAENFIEKNKDYIYIWSEDNGHIPCFNWIENWVLEKEEAKDFEIIIKDDVLSETDAEDKK